MNELNYEELTNAELATLCNERAIDVDSKNVNKPNKAEYLAALYKKDKELDADVDDFLNTDDEETEDGLQTKETKTEEVAKPKELTRGQRRRQQYNAAHALKRVIVNSNSDNQTKTNLVFITWGNRLLGYQTDRVYLGKPWHVRQGALDNMQNAIITESVQNEEQNRVDTITKPAYLIQHLPPLTREEIEAIGKRQQIRDSSIESLI